jgi:hypothetical protein
MPDPVIEILAYTPINMDEFIRFCRDGKPDGKGDFETDEQGRKIVGVLRWLHGREVSKARFFNTKSDDPLRLFVAMIARQENYDVPWIERIPGFERMVISDGLVGKDDKFQDLPDLFLLLQPNEDLNGAFEQGTGDVERIVERIDQNEVVLSGGRREFLATLRGDIGTDQGLFQLLNKRFNTAL